MNQPQENHRQDSPLSQVLAENFLIENSKRKVKNSQDS